VAGGVNGFKVVGMVLGLAVHSRALGFAMGMYGAGVSVFSGFFAKGHEVEFPKKYCDGDRDWDQENAKLPIDPKCATALPMHPLGWGRSLYVL